MFLTKDKIMISWKKILIIGVSTLLVIILFVLLYVFRPVKSIEKAKPDYKVTASQLFDDFTENEKQADSLYVGKIILVKGKIKEIIYSNNEWVILLETDDPFAGISCSLNNSENAKAESLNGGQHIVVKGQCSGMLMDVLLNNCFVLDD